MLAYVSPSVANAGAGEQKVSIRQSPDGRTWTDVSLPAAAAATAGGANGVGLGADRAGLQRVLATGLYTRKTALRYYGVGNWESTETVDVFVPPTGANPQNRNNQSAPAVAHQPGRHWIVAMNSCSGALRMLEFNPAAEPAPSLTPMTPDTAFSCQPETTRRPVIVAGKDKMLVANLVAPDGATERLDVLSAAPTAAAVAAFAPITTLPALPAGERLLDVCLTQDNRGNFFLGLLTVVPGNQPGSNEPRNPSVHLFQAPEATLAFAPAGAPIANLGIGQARRLQCAAAPGGASVLVLTVGEFEQTATFVSTTGGPAERLPANTVRSIFTGGGAANLPFTLVLAGQPPQ